MIEICWADLKAACQSGETARYEYLCRLLLDDETPDFDALYTLPLYAQPLAAPRKESDPMNVSLTRREFLAAGAASAAALALSGCDNDQTPLTALAILVDPTTCPCAKQHAAEVTTLLAACVGLEVPLALLQVRDERDANCVLLGWEGKLTRQNLESVKACVPALFLPPSPDSGSDVAGGLRAARNWLKSQPPPFGRRVLVAVSDLVPDPRKEGGRVVRSYDNPCSKMVANDLSGIELHLFAVRSQDIAATEAAHPTARVHQEGVALTPELIRLPRLYQ